MFRSAIRSGTTVAARHTYAAGAKAPAISAETSSGRCSKADRRYWYWS